MLDRASTFAESDIVSLLKTSFIPVAIDQAYQRRQQDAEGEFYRKIAGQGPRSNFQGTTQGFYIATAAGRLLLYNNNRDPQKLLRLMREKLREFESSDAAAETVAAIDPGKLDNRYNVRPPEGGLVVRVRAKVLGGYESTSDAWREIFQTSLSRDNLWISRNEHAALAKGTIPESVRKRIALFHLIDNTRGEPPMWKEEEIRKLEMSIENGRVRGTVRLESVEGDRGYQAEIRGVIDSSNGVVTRFDAVALGQFHGEGPFTRGAPPGKFPLAISFSLADGSDLGDTVPPQGSRGWLQGYLAGR